MKKSANVVMSVVDRTERVGIPSVERMSSCEAEPSVQPLSPKDWRYAILSTGEEAR